MKKKKAIYKITNKINNKVYIGQSQDPIRRWKEHKWDAFNPNCKEKSAIHLQRSFGLWSKTAVENVIHKLYGIKTGDETTADILSPI